MKTLYEKIKPEILERILNDEEQFPQLVELLLRELRGNMSPLNIPLNECIHIYGYAYPGESFSVVNFLNLFEYEN